MTSYSPILAIPEIGQNQNNKYLTHADAIKFLEWSANRRLVKTGSYTSNEWLPTETEFTRNAYFKASGAAAAFNFVCPAATNVTTKERIFVVENADTTYTLTVKSNAAGTVVALAPGTVGIFSRKDDDITAITLLDTTGRAYDLGCFVPGMPTAGGIVFWWTAVHAFKLLGNAAGSKGICATNPTATAVFDLQKNESSVGSISVSTSGVFTFTTTSGNPVTLAVGDRLSIIAPATQDTTLADVAISLYGLRT